MATTAAPYGFRPVGVLGAGTFSGATRQYKVTNSYGTSIFYGDVVKIVAAGTVEKDTGTTTMTPVGIFVGCSYTDPGTNQPTYAQMWIRISFSRRKVMRRLPKPAWGTMWRWFRLLGQPQLERPKTPLMATPLLRQRPCRLRFSALLMVRPRRLVILTRTFFVSSTVPAMPRATLVLHISYKIQPVYRRS